MSDPAPSPSVDIAALAPGLSLGSDGIWRTPDTPPPLSYPEEGNDWCRSVEDDSFWFQHRNRCIVAIARRLPPDGLIVDIGGGNGCVARALLDAGFPVVLLEPGSAGAANARKRGVPTVIEASLAGAAFRPGSLPAAGLFDVIEHLPDDGAMLRAAAELLSPGGRLYLTVPAYRLLWSADDHIAGHHRRYRLASLRRRFDAAGLQMRLATGIFRCLVPAIALLRTIPSRLSLHRRAGSPRLDGRDHALPSGLPGRLLAGVLDREAAALAAGRTFAWGASLLVVAEKR